MKKISLKILLIITAGIPAFAFADSSSTITLPSNFNDNIWTQAQNIFNAFSSYIEMIVGVILALVVIEAIINALRKPNG